MYIETHQKVLSCATQYLDMIRCLSVVSHLTCLNFAMFADIIIFDVCLKRGMFKSCFQQCAKSKMTALTERSYDVVVKFVFL